MDFFGRGTECPRHRKVYLSIGADTSTILDATSLLCAFRSCVFCKNLGDKLETNLQRFEDCAVAGGGGEGGHPADGTFFFVATDEVHTQEVAQKVCHLCTGQTVNSCHCHTPS